MNHTSPARLAIAWALAAIVFLVLATANSAGYRYGASDQAFYQPAIALAANPDLFPRDRVLLAPQMELWVGDSLFGWIARAFDHDLAAVSAVVYVFTLLLLFGAGIAFARGIGATWEATAAFLILLTLRHQIARTGANSLEGYMHPRMLAFAIGVGSFACIVRQRPVESLAVTALATAVHTTTGLWFLVVAAFAAGWRIYRAGKLSASIMAAAGVLGAAALVALTAVDRFAARLVEMDPMWLDAIGDRAYLFSGEWPLEIWLVNLAYPVLLVLVYQRRRASGLARAPEGALVCGLLALVALFLISVPLTDRRVALAVQLQVNRIFWLLDVAVACYLAWWLIDGVGARWSTTVRRVALALLVGASAARGVYLIQVSPGRPLVELELPQTSWTQAMEWLRTQPSDLHVLADPQHVWRFGSSVRVAAARDTLLEAGKDPALAIYDRETARRVLARGQALAGFDSFTTSDVVSLAEEYDLDVFVDHVGRAFDFPVVYRNDEFVIYDLR